MKMASNCVLLQFCAFLALYYATACTGEIISLCPGQNRDIFCTGPGEVIVFQSASWGMRSRSSVCGASPPPQDLCSSNIILSVLTTNCFRLSVCPISHDGVSTYFRDPCTADYTELIINYLCVPSDTIGFCTNETLTVRSQRFIHSSGYPSGYPVGYRCKLQLTGGHGMIMKITMLYLRLRYSSDRRNCDDRLVFIKDDSNPQAYILCDPNQVQYDYNLPNNADETFTLQYGLQISYQVEVTFEASQFDDYPNRGFLFKVEVVGCSNDDLERFQTKATIDYFEASNRVTYRCPDGYELFGPGLVVCDGSNWIGSPGNCIPRSVDIHIDHPSSTTKNQASTTTTESTTTTTTTTTISTPTPASKTTTPVATTTTEKTTTATMKTSLPTLPTSVPTSLLTTTEKKTTHTTPKTSLPTTLPTSLPTTIEKKTTKITQTSQKTSLPTTLPTSLQITSPATLSTSLSNTPTAKTTIPTTVSPTTTASITPFFPSASTSVTPLTSSTTSPSTSNGTNVGLNVPPSTVEQSTPTRRISNDIPEFTTESTKTPIGASEVEEGSISVWTMTAIGLSIGVIGLILIFLLIMFFITRSRRRKKQEEESVRNPASTLRPSAHACVSIPNTYGGNIGYAMPKSSSKSFKEQVAEEEIIDDDNDTVGRLKRKHGIKLNNNKAIIDSNDEVKTSKISDISFQSSLYEMANGRISNHGSGGSSTFVPDESSGITADYYVERTGYAAGTTGFLQGSGEFPEVHFVEVGSQRNIDSVRLSSNLEPIAEESQLHHSDIINDTSDDTQRSENIVNMDAVLAELQSRNSTGSQFSADSQYSGSQYSAALSTIPEESRLVDEGEDESINSSQSTVIHKPTGAIRTPYMRTSLEGTRIPRATLKLIEKSKVQYALFKGDETGNLENYLDDRRGSY